MQLQFTIHHSPFTLGFGSATDHGKLKTENGKLITEARSV